jgi:hypothetical protein
MMLVLDVEDFPCTYNPLHYFGLQQVWYGISTHPNSRSAYHYLLPSQQLKLEEHVISDIQLLRFFLHGGFSQVLSGGQHSTEVVESCCGVAPHTLYAGRGDDWLEAFDACKQCSLSLK